MAPRGPAGIVGSEGSEPYAGKGGAVRYLMNVQAEEGGVDFAKRFFLLGNSGLPATAPKGEAQATQQQDTHHDKLLSKQNPGRFKRPPPVTVLYQYSKAFPTRASTGSEVEPCRFG
jgi:hypothetical protein